MAAIFGSPCLPQAGTVRLPYGYSIFVIPASHLSFPCLHAEVQAFRYAGVETGMTKMEVAAPCEPERMWLGIKTYSETQPEGCGYLENNCPEVPLWAGFRAKARTRHRYLHDKV